jgi:hypothetical protein
LGGRFGGFVSGLEIPFPGNGDRRTQRRGSNAELPRRKSEHLVLPGPFGRHVAEAGHSHAMGERALDGRSDEIGREECERDRAVCPFDNSNPELLHNRLQSRQDKRAELMKAVERLYIGVGFFILNLIAVWA